MSKKVKPSVSIVVLNWNGKRFIDPFMRSFAKQTYGLESVELLFVDNDSSDDSVAYYKEKYFDDKTYKLVLNGGNYGYSEGNNKGMRHAKGDYVLVCNNDLELDKNLIKELVATSEKTKSAVTVPKLMYLNKPGIINNAGSRLDTKSDWPIYEDNKDEKDVGQYDEIAEITAFCGACVLFTREFLQKVGIFDRKFFMYFEDGDLSWRGQTAGYKFYYAPTAVAYHVHTGSSTEGSPLFNHFVGRNRLLILTKNAQYRYIAKAWAKTLRDHLLLRVKRLGLAVIGKYPKKLALQEFLRSQKMIWAAILMTPYALCKRYKIIHEDTI